MDALVSRLFEIHAVRFGSFKLKSGMMSPIYIDLRVVIGYPDLMNSLTESMYDVMNKTVDQLCGVPYTALPLAAVISAKHNIPSVIKRKDVKTYGTKKLIEGVFSEGQSCCIIEDVITTGSSVLETAADLRGAGLRISEAIVIVDRGQGGRDNLIRAGINVKSLLTLNEIISILLRLEKITQDQYDVSNEFINIPKVNIPIQKMTDIDWMERSAASNNKVVKRLFEIMYTKKSHLCVAADVTSMSDLLCLAKKVAPFVCILKIHANIIHDFNVSEMAKLKQMSLEHEFLLMEDHKFADIGNTVKSQLENKLFDYLSWCDLITVNCAPGDSVLIGIESAVKERGNIELGCVLIAEMSCVGAISYKEDCAALALRHKDIVAGFVSQSLVTDSWPGFIHCTPGVKIIKGGDNLGQNYRSVEELTVLGFVDVFIVGRGITEALCPATEAEIYCQATMPRSTRN